MDLVKKIKTNVGIFGAVGLVGILGSGCETAEGTALLSALYGANAGLATNPREAVAWGALAQGAQTAAIIQGQREAAEAGRSQVSINVQTSENRQEDYRYSYYDDEKDPDFVLLKKRIPDMQSPYLFLYNKYIDLDGSNTVEPNEYFGIKEEYELGKENIRAAYFYKAVKGDNSITVRLWSDSGELLAESNFNIYSEYNGYRARALGGISNSADGERDDHPDVLKVMAKLRESGPGNYAFTATANGGQLRRADFGIKRKSAASSSE